MPKKLTIQYLPPSKLKVNPDNPRLIKDANFKKLVKSLQNCPELFDARPCICSNRTGDLVILGGNMRFRCAMDLKYDKIPVIVMEGLTVEQEREIAIKDNADAFGEFDWDILANSWSDLPLVEWGVDLPEHWMASDESETPQDAEPQLDKAEELNKIWKVKSGDLWQVGAHRLLCGNSTKAEDVARVMGGEKAGAVVTDPPYGIGIDGQKKSICKNPKHNRKAHAFGGWDSERPPEKLFTDLLLFDCPAVIFGGNYFADLLPPSRGWLYWGKGQDGLTMSDGELAWSNMNKPLRAITVNRANLGNTAHPTQKPVEVMAFAIKFTETEGNIYDPFLGSGTTMVAAQNLGRKCYGIEISENYCAVILQRMKDAFPGIEIRRAERG